MIYIYIYMNVAFLPGHNRGRPSGVLRAVCVCKRTFLCDSKFQFYCGSLDFIVNVKFVMHVLNVT
jgi:hypothetical protein